jgi:hypothetical protein
VVSKEASTFGLPGKQERVVCLDADHNSICKFGDSQEDRDNWKKVRGNIVELCHDALSMGESLRLPSAPKSDIETRFASLRNRVENSQRSNKVLESAN